MPEQRRVALGVPRLRVLTLHSPYRSGFASGENRVVEEEAALLRMAGHEVTAWEGEATPRRSSVAAGVSAIWSVNAARQVEGLIDELQPHVVHVHNLYPLLSPAVIVAANRRAVPTVLTLHNYRLMCPSATLLRDGRTCEACVGRIPWRAVVHRCYRGSAGASAAIALSLAGHRRAGTFDRVTRFVAVSAFVRRQHVRAGIDERRIIVKPNFAWAAPVRKTDGEYFLYLGRLSPEKGVDWLPRVWREGALAHPVLVVGDGPELSRLRRSAPSSFVCVGNKAPEEVAELLTNARALLVPSLSYEGSPRTIVEAYAAGVPVLANRVGAIPEFVEHGVTGFLADVRHSASWLSGVQAMLDAETNRRCGERAHARWAAEYSPAQNVRRLEDVYGCAIAAAEAAAA